MTDWVYGASELDNGDREGPRRDPWSLARLDALAVRLAAAFPQTVHFICRQCGPVSLAQITEPTVVVVEDLVRAHIRGHQERN